MILKRFFKPKWQHPNPDTRKQAIQELSATDPVLAQIAREDKEPSVRTLALARVSDLALLRRLAGEDADAAVRESAALRFRTLMAGEELGSPPLKIRLQSLDDESLLPGCLEYLAVHAKEAELRLALLARVDQEPLLSEIAVKDPVSDIQFAALARVRESDTLERIAKETRNRNKRLHRAAQERLDEFRAERERVARIEQVCGAMEALAADLAAGANDTRFRTLEKSWDELVGDAGDDHAARYRAAHEQVLARAQESAAQQGVTQERYHSLEDLQARLATEVELSDELATVVHDTLERLAANAVAGAMSKTEQQRYHLLTETIRTRTRLLQREHERARRQREVIARAVKLSERRSAVRSGDVTQLQKFWKSLEHPETAALATQLQGQFDAALTSLHGRLGRQEEQQQQTEHEVEQLLEQLEQVLDEGKLQQAIALNDQIRQRLKQHPLSRGGKAAAEHRLQNCAATLGELRGWRRWGTKQARENLCDEAEALIGVEDEPPAIAKRVQRLRMIWKSLDGTEGASSKTTWERFNTACERAYEPCQAYFDGQSKERQENLEKRRAVCEKLEAFEADTDWENVDWRHADRTRNDALKRWRRLGPVDRAERKEIERRFRKISQRFNKHLEKQREYDLQRREELINQVEALIESEDLRAAVEGAKQAQLEWHPQVLASRGKEQALWRQFRAACDAIFERRQAELQVVDGERKENLAKKTAICEEIEGLAAQEPDARRARSRLHQLQQEWPRIGHVPQSSYKSIEQRFVAACREFEQQLKAHAQAALRQAMQDLADRAVLCARIENLLAVAATDVVEIIEQARRDWAELTPAESALAQVIGERFDKACEAVAGAGPAREALRQELENNLEAKRTLCLRMEIQAGVDSPPEFAEARLAYQVERLSESLTGGNHRGGAQDQAREIEQQWYLSGVLPQQEAAALEARFTRALDALHQRSA